ncbi:MAG: hypothetical protein H6559_08755 [Lewinellaceae bacterium]|nr:hypothetical protein [Lewinellaceae bacterium]
MGLKIKILTNFIAMGEKINKNDNRCFFPYAYMPKAAFDIEGRLAILTSARIIIIEGRGLKMNPIRDR